MTRALGDECACSVGVNSCPTIQQFKLELSNSWKKDKEEWTFNDSMDEVSDFAIVVASDGLWDAISKEGVAKVCGRYFTRMAEEKEDVDTQLSPPIQAEKCVRHLISYAVKQLQKIKEEDNVTTICVFFGNPIVDKN